MVTYLAAYVGYNWWKSDNVTEEAEDSTEVNVQLLSTSDEIVNNLRKIDKRLLLVLLILLTVIFFMLILTKFVITLRRKTKRGEIICKNCDFN